MSSLDDRNQTTSNLQALNPEGWPEPKGYANGIKGRGTLVVLGGQIGWDAQGHFPTDFVDQVRQALANISTLLTEAGVGPEHLARLTWYVTDMESYRSRLREIGRAYREVLGRNFPSMALVQVVSLVEREAMVEIEATAILPDA